MTSFAISKFIVLFYENELHLANNEYVYCKTAERKKEVGIRKEIQFKDAGENQENTGENSCVECY